MFCVYVLKSERNAKRYVGASSKSAQARTADHNAGTNKFTRANRPWKLIYQEVFPAKDEALRREKFLKSGQGRKWLDNNN